MALSEHVDYIQNLPKNVTQVNFTGGKNAFIQDLHDDYIMIF